jgi:enoyl-CoA hydratase
VTSDGPRLNGRGGGNLKPNSAGPTILPQRACHIPKETPMSNPLAQAAPPLAAPTVVVERRGPVTIVTINRPDRRNAVDGPTADGLSEAFRTFEADPSQAVAVLTGAGGTFCAGADLKAFHDGPSNRLDPDMLVDGPMGPSRMLLSKPVIAAIEGYAVAGGIELACWCDLRVAAETAKLGVFCRRFGVPLIDGGTVRLPRLIGLSRALDLILTGREVSAAEAYSIGLANRVVPDGQALAAAVALATELSALPQTCMRNDRLSAYSAFDGDLTTALRREFQYGLATLASGEAAAGSAAFTAGAGRGGNKVG